MKPTLSQGGHSAHVKIDLLLEGRSIPVAQLAPDFLLLDTAINLPPGEATLVLRVDESERHWRVRLPDGASATSLRVALAVA